MMRPISFILIFIVSFPLYSQFHGLNGIYALGTAGRPMDPKISSLPFVSGVAVRFKWESVETSPDTYDWSYIDNEIHSAESLGKKVVLEVLGVPSWIHDVCGAKVYYYIDQNTAHSTYGDTLFGYIPWDEIYLQNLGNFIVAMGRKYASDTSVVYVNAVSGNISRNLPEKIADGRSFWQAYNYNPDTLVSALKRIVDIYMSSFPNTPLWSSMDYVSFERKASGKEVNYVCSEYAAYGAKNFTTRFGLWREDLSGCTLNPPNSGSQWAVMSKYPDRTGAQMLWDVQDGPTRMNKCGLPDTSKMGVMKAALDNGLLFGMRYFEVYVSDLTDLSLFSLFSKYADKLRTLSVTMAPEDIPNNAVPVAFELRNNFPNPFNPSTEIQYVLIHDAHVRLDVFNVLGQHVETLVNENQQAGVYKKMFDAGSLNSGVYFYRMTAGPFFQTRKMQLAR